LTQLITEDPHNADWRGLEWVTLVDKARWRGALAGLDVNAEQNYAAAEDALARALRIVEEFDPADEHEILWPSRRALLQNQRQQLQTAQGQTTAARSTNQRENIAADQQWIGIDALVRDIAASQPMLRPVRALMRQSLDQYRAAPTEEFAVGIVEIQRNFARTLREQASPACHYEADRLLRQGRELLVELRNEGKLSSANAALIDQLDQELAGRSRGE
jgi:hypothetical protein